MVRRILAVGLCAAAIACTPQKAPKKSGPVVASGKGISITADEFKARLDEQSPFIRARYASLDRKKEFLDNLIRFEVLAREAERQHLDKDPDVQNTLKKIMVQRLVQKNFQDTAGTGDVPDADIQKYFDEHRDEFNRPRRVRVAAVIWNAPQGSPDRAKKLALAQKALAKLKVEEKKNTLAFAQIVAEYSEDAATKPLQGDLQFKSQEELAKAYSKEVAEAAFKLKAGESSPVVQAPQGIYLLKYTGEQPELVRTLDQAKAQIANRLHREKKTKEFDEWLKGLRERAEVKTNDKALEAIEVAAAPAAPAMPGMPGAHPSLGGPNMPQPPPVGATAAPQPAPVK
jgi:peptidyl-prolyl cis-trans isomerase C